MFLLKAKFSLFKTELSVRVFSLGRHIASAKVSVEFLPAVSFWIGILQTLYDLKDAETVV